MDSAQDVAEYVIGESDGILPPYEALYLESIIYSADRSNDAFNLFAISVDSGEEDEIVVAHVQEVLTHAAALSRFFWPSLGGQGGKTLRELREARARKLRTAFQLSDDSSLRDRGIRDALEHFDERLDDFLLSLKAGRIFPRPMVARISNLDEPTFKVFRMVDPEAMCFVLFGKEHYFAGLRDEVFDVLEAALEMDRNGSRLVAVTKGVSLSP